MAAHDTLATADKDLLERFEAHGQGHVFRFLSELTLAARERLLAQARSLDLTAVEALASTTGWVDEGVSIEPPGDELIALNEAGAARRAEAYDVGLEQIRAGRVAVVVAAGGQGTRLGSPAPKGMWPVGPTSGKPLLQWLAEKVLHWTRECGRPIPFVVMVSEATAHSTHDFLRWHRYFGLDPTWVRTACQPSLPCVTAEGRLLLAARDRIATAPNGHGGVYETLVDSGVLDLLTDHGVRTFSYVQVDNPLVQPVDPTFLGLHHAAGSAISSKSVRKTSAAERVGVFARVGGRSAIVEYSELSAERAAAVGDDGRLLFGQGSIAAHCLDAAFVREMAGDGLPYHHARKAVPYVDETGARIEPSEPNATKFERFLFDAIPLAERSLVVETARAEEFAPIKNATGTDSPETSREALCELFRAWHRRAGLDVPDGLLELDPSRYPNERAFRAHHGLPAG